MCFLRAYCHFAKRKINFNYVFSRVVRWPLVLEGTFHGVLGLNVVLHVEQRHDLGAEFVRDQETA